MSRGSSPYLSGHKPHPPRQNPLEWLFNRLGARNVGVTIDGFATDSDALAAVADLADQGIRAGYSATETGPVISVARRHLRSATPTFNKYRSDL